MFIAELQRSLRTTQARRRGVNPENNALGWDLWPGLDASLTLGALRMALRKGAPKIHHSEQGVQYACADCIQALPEWTQISWPR